MAHELDFTTGRAAFAHVGETAWHGFGNLLTEGASIEDWRVEAGLNFDIVATPVYAGPSECAVRRVKAYKALSRSDTGDVLSVQSERYHVVQPAEVLEFFRDLTAQHGYKLETAGALRGGRRFWALARTGRVAVILNDDEIRDYLLLSTSCDGSLATTAQYTSIRVVCNNTLSYAVDIGDKEGAARKVRVQHSAKFIADDVKGELGASTDHWASFIARTTAQAKQGMSVDQAVRFFTNLLNVGDAISKAEQRKVERLMHEWTAGVGAEMASAHGTLWGVVNAVTHVVDHGHKELVEGSRMNNAWFGHGARLKARAVQLADEVLATV